jgi:hypothetical protein
MLNSNERGKKGWKQVEKEKQSTNVTSAVDRSNYYRMTEKSQEMTAWHICE